jgi:hypothetical protein
LNASLLPAALELFRNPPSDGGTLHDGIGLPVKIPIGLPGCGGGTGWSGSGSAMPGKAELVFRSGALVSGLGAPGAFPDLWPTVDPWPGKYGVSRVWRGCRRQRSRQQ